MSNETAMRNIGTNLTLGQAQDVVEEYAPSDYFRDTYRAWETRYLPHVCDEVEGMEPCGVLDIGPGWGTMAVWLSSRGHNVDAIDNAPEGKFITTDLRGLLGMMYHQSSIEMAVILAGFYEVVLMTQVLTHLKWRPDWAMRQVAKAVAHDGVAIISVTDAEQYKYGDVPFDNWRDVPALRSGPVPLPDGTICTYTEETFEDLLRSVFSEVAISKSEGAQTLIAECWE